MWQWSSDAPGTSVRGAGVRPLLLGLGLLPGRGLPGGLRCFEKDSVEIYCYVLIHMYIQQNCFW